MKKEFVWPSANGGTEERKEMPVFSGFRKMALIQAFGPSCGLWPLADGKEININVVGSEIRSGQEFSGKYGHRHGRIDARNGQGKTKNE